MDLTALKEDLLTLPEACKILPRRPSPATLWRWRKKGVNGVRLACVKVGNRWCTTRSALLEFLQKQTEAAATSGAATSKQVGAAQRTSAVTRRLIEAGCLSSVEAKASNGNRAATR